MDKPMIALKELKDRITADVPTGYTQYVQDKSTAFLREQGFDPRTILVLNLELQRLEQTEEHRGRFFLNGDGCGNYYFCNPKEHGDKVMLWNHDPVEIADLSLRLAAYLPTAEQYCRIDFPVQPGELYICRTKLYGESILNPILLEEWISAVNDTPGIEYFGYRLAENPFTGEMNRFEIPGFSVISTETETQNAQYFLGRVQLKDTPPNRTISATLAKKLGANVLTNLSNE